MRIFHKIQAVENRRLYIPYAMRAALGWHQNQPLFCWTRAEDDDSARNQISLSATKPSPNAIWTLSARFRDRQGLLATLSDLLRQENVNIITCRGSSSMQNREFSVEMEIDLHDYARKHDPALRQLHMLIVCKFVRDIVFEPDNSPRLEIVANRELADSRPIRLIENTGVINRHVLIPLVFLERTIDYFRQQHHVPGKTGPLLAAVVGDVKSAVVDATLFYRHTGYKHVRVKLKDGIGTLHKLTEALRRFGFNVLQSYHRTIQPHVMSQTDLLVYRHRGAENVEMDHELMKEIRLVLETSPALQDLAPEVIEPKLSVPKWQGEDRWLFNP